MAESHDTTEPVRSRTADFDRLRFLTPETPCPYLPDRLSRSEAYYVEHMDGSAYEKLMARGFRRSGRVIYRPRCRGCGECRQLRVPIDRFAPSKSMRRIGRRNADLTVSLGAPTPTEQKFDIFTRYLDHQHDDMMPRTYESFTEFLYDSPMATVEICYCLGRRIVSVSIADRCPGGLSSVYCYFDPEYQNRCLGTFSVLWEIEHCRTTGQGYYYMGYYIANSPTMAYKTRFRPTEILVGDDQWIIVT